MAPTDLGFYRPIAATSCVLSTVLLSVPWESSQCQTAFRRSSGWSTAGQLLPVDMPAPLSWMKQEASELQPCLLHFFREKTAGTRMAGLHEAPLSCGSVQKFGLTLHLFFSTCPISMTLGAGQGKHAGTGSLLKIPPEALSFVLFCLLRCASHCAC